MTRAGLFNEFGLFQYSNFICGGDLAGAIGGASVRRENSVIAGGIRSWWGHYRRWPKARRGGLSRIHDQEMARINIEVSAALEQWIDLMRHDPERYRRLVELAMRHLPMTFWDTEITRDPDHLVTLAQPSMAARLMDAVAPHVLEKAQVEVRAHPTRVLANAMTNFCWRGGPIEDIHAGQWSEYPSLQRRITPSEERMLMREAVGRLAQGIVAISELLFEKSDRSWSMRVLPYHLVPYWLVTPTNWSLEKQTSDLQLPGREPRLARINDQKND